MITDFKFEDGKLTATRVYDAPRELVFEAWVETDKIGQWWGCANTTNVRSTVEPRVGGKYDHHITIKGVEEEIPGNAILVEFDPPKKLAYESILLNDSSPKMHVSVEFSEVDEGTKVVLVHSGIPDVRVDGDVELREIIQGGWTAALDKLSKVFASVD